MSNHGIVAAVIAALFVLAGIGSQALHNLRDGQTLGAWEWLGVLGATPFDIIALMEDSQARRR
ncbi:hypothetical protein GCM10027026_46510 [Myroides odoratimimus subsp. xuanwuensis]